MIREEKPPREDIATPPLPVDHRHVAGQDNMSCQEVSNQVRHFQCPSEYPAPDQELIIILPATASTIQITDIGYIVIEPPLLRY